MRDARARSTDSLGKTAGDTVIKTMSRRARLVAHCDKSETASQLGHHSLSTGLAHLPLVLFLVFGDLGEQRMRSRSPHKILCAEIFGKPTQTDTSVTGVD